jgi:hypothetical protein
MDAIEPVPRATQTKRPAAKLAAVACLDMTTTACMSDLPSTARAPTPDTADVAPGSAPGHFWKARLGRPEETSSMRPHPSPPIPTSQPPQPNIA